MLPAKPKENDTQDCKNYEHSATGADTPDGSNTELNGHGGGLA